ncbi:MAG: alpha-L-fucosidase [Clostridia bacterium]|nr:alpha-L-fucosidase [Clostridia bacterium]
MNVRFNDVRDWFFKKRYGLFIHWGIYAVDGWHEQMIYRGKLTRKEYVPKMFKFNPVGFNPDQWIDLAIEAGMEYLCFTTKHVDGFCMFNTKYTEFNIMNTPYMKDILKMLADACHRRNFPLCLYYSICDMNHINYPNQGRPYELPGPEQGDQPDQEKYLEFVRNQVIELCTNYGEIHGFWWDANIISHKDESVNNLIRSLQPKAVINNRGFDEGDFGTPEREYDFYSHVDSDVSFKTPVEACQAVGTESWGYRVDEDYYTNRYLMESIDKIMAKGGNYLLNVGPDQNGEINKKSSDILLTIGNWLKKVKISLYEVIPSSILTTNRDVLITKKENKLYIHLFKSPIKSSVYLPPISTLPKKAVLLNNMTSVKTSIDITPHTWNDEKRTLRLCDLPVNEFLNEVMVIELEF